MRMNILMKEKDSRIRTGQKNTVTKKGGNDMTIHMIVKMVMEVITASFLIILFANKTETRKNRTIYLIFLIILLLLLL